MASDNIESPPYPGHGSNPDVLYNHLKALRKWVEAYRGEHNKAVGKAVVPALREFPDKKAYVSQPVTVMMGHYLFLRRLRESWDHLVRTYEFEADWASRMCLRQRVLLLQAAAVTLNNAFTPQEHREAAEQRNLNQIHQMFERLSENLAEYMEPKRNDPEAEKPKGL